MVWEKSPQAFLPFFSAHVVQGQEPVGYEAHSGGLGMLSFLTWLPLLGYAYT